MPSVAVQAPDRPEPLTLEQLASMAIGTHPAIQAAEARVIAAGHNALQAGLRPNPTIGLFGNEIGNDGEAQYGAFVSRTIQRGAKRHFDRNVQIHQATYLDRQLTTTTQRILSDVRIAFFKLLIAQRKLELAQQMNETQQHAVRNARQLYEAMETPKTELLQVEIQAEKIEIGLATARIAELNAWRELTALTGLNDPKPRPVTGSLDEIVEPLDWNSTVQQMMTSSPQVLQAKALVDKTRAVIDQQLAYGVPNFNTQYSVGLDTATNDVFGGFQFGVPLQINDWNQGRIAAARAEHQAACHQLENIKRSIQKQLAVVYQEYQSSSAESKVYIEEILPRSRETLDLVTQAHQEGEIGFLQLLSAQQTLINATSSYLDSLRDVWLSRQKIEGFLLVDSQDN